MQLDAIPDDWTDPNTTPLDFLIVGSGAGGAPLAARLAERGYNVAVFEMGPAKPERASGAIVENTEVPLLHPETTEDERHSLRYFVNHFDHDPDKSQDPKSHQGDDRTKQGIDKTDDKGIFYPRAQGIGGCTIHNAMITMAGPPEDWDAIAEATSDPSWSGENMRAYFQRIENCLYDRPSGLFARFKRLLGISTRWSRGRHGHNGWLHTSIASLRFLKREKQFLKVILSAIAVSVDTATDYVSEWVRPILKGKPLPELDPNHWETQNRSQEGLTQIPIAVDHQGRRSSPRKRLFDVCQKFPDRLKLCTEMLVTEVLLGQSKSDESKKPDAIGLRVLPKAHSYQADPRYDSPSDFPNDECINVYCNGEVILAGGTFNTPQLLMLSGIGPKDQLDQHEIQCTVDLPGTGRNLQDRYEIPVTATLTGRFKSLDSVTLTSSGTDAENDPELKRWINAGPDVKDSFYSTNGGIVGYFKRSNQETRFCDLFMFAIAGYFPGYHIGWSQPSRLAPNVTAGDVAESSNENRAALEKRTLTWLILKARSHNRTGTVSLRSSDPRRRPDINFRSFANTTDEKLVGVDRDLEALCEGLETVKSMLDHGIKRGVIHDYQLPGLEAFSGNERKWIRHIAWGHHASGTCRIGPPSDTQSVVDSRLKVHKVNRLRIVDASVFPRIPGYFLVTNIYMLSEKAADMISEDHPSCACDNVDGPPILSSDPVSRSREAYPAELESTEAELIQERRDRAGVQ